ncbi:MAG: RagB/SusD family nutrient uptake outer membrane protein [Alistipes sp.]|nr:RagB/SusD family nutrient uptake outer membrane protein [Alistipes sp.]
MKLRNIIIAASALAAVSCSYLDVDETSGIIKREDLYGDFSRVKSMLTKVYVSMPYYNGFSFANGSVNNLAMRDCASDDAEFGAASALIQNVNNGNWSATNTWDDAWSLYEGIRYANMFLADFDSVDISQNYPNGGYEKDMAQMQYYPYEARVLRAYYFFELARRYGDIAMPLKVLTKDEANSIGKTSFDKVIDFIVSECTESAEELPTTFKGVGSADEIGRVTKGFALALKTKALLYAASPLHNESGDAEKWKAAARAAQEVMDLGVYALDKDGCWNNTVSSELILARMYGVNNSSYELYNFPVRFTYGGRSAAFISGGNYPSQNLVDAFETVNGYKVTLDESGWHSDDPSFREQQPYANRDPRLARTILADGMSFKGETLETYEGGADDVSVPMGGSATGYFVRKYIQEDVSFDPTSPVSYQHHWVVSRYAEILLSYAEAMVNAFGDGGYSDGEFKRSALSALNEVRTNAGMPAVVNDSKANLIERIQNEWRVEFAFEDHRFWDVRRWKIGDRTQRQLYGVYITRNNNVKIYRRKLVENRVWSERMNLYPIPQSELFINGNLYPQNPQW